MKKHIEITSMAYNNCVFYKNYYKEIVENKINEEIFEKLPFLTKNVLQANQDSFLFSEINDSYEIHTTSGTTGLPLKICWTANEFIKSNFYTWVCRKNWYKTTPDKKYLTFHSSLQDNNGYKLSEILIYNNNRTLSLARYIYNDSVLRRYVEAIDMFKPYWILGQPSVMYILAKFMLNNKIVFNYVKYIELNGEFVEPAMLAQIKKAFPDVPVSNLYGSTEFNGIALTCPYEKMHILGNNVYVESIKRNGLPHLFVTGLVNTAMPIIRYSIGDVGEIVHESNCSCGSSTPILTLWKGRVHELITLKNNMELDPAIFLNIINEINSENDIIIQFRVKIITDNKIALYLLIDRKNEKYIDFRKSYILNRLKAFNLNISFEIKLIFNEKEMLGSDGKFTFVHKNKFH